MKPFLHLLSPKILEENKDKAYHAVTELAEVLSKDGCNNIALTGTFGSGKSSIVKTLKSITETKDVKFLNVSLATLDKNQKKVEYSILQQLRYKADSSNLTQSRFKTIHHIDKSRLNNYVLYTLVFILAFFIAVEPSWLKIDAVYDLYYSILSPKVGYWVNIFTDVIALFYMVWCCYFIIRHMLKRLYNSNLHKFNFKEGSVEICKDASAFNQHLDEIIYFFEATQYNVVVFEDLDRADDPRQLFLKLREINSLINDSHRMAGEKSIRFIYAIKDEIFTGEERTKYFDYIVSAIPVVNANNSGDYLMKNYGKSGFVISDKQWTEFGMYIGGMRELLNIINEFIQYKNQIDGCEDHKLFAITIYKNKHPEDYAKLHLKSGVLYNCIQAKSDYVALASEGSKLSLSKIEKEWAKTKQSITDIRIICIKQLKDLINPTILIFEGEECKIDDVALNNRFFNAIRHNKNIEYYTLDTETGKHDRNKLKLEIKFEEIEERVNPGFLYIEYVSPLENDLKSLTERIQELKSEISTIKKSSISIILKRCESEKVLDNTIRIIFNKTYPNNKQQEEDAMCDMVLFMLRNGYVDEQYNQYISHFHSGSLTESDIEFLRNLPLDVSRPYDYEINNIDNLLPMFNIDYYNTKAILNYAILDELLSKKNEYIDELNRIVELLKSSHIVDFVVGYDDNGKYQNNFFELLLSKWDSYIDDIFRAGKIEVRDKLLIAFFKYCPQNSCNNFVKNAELLNGCYRLLDENINSFDFTQLSKRLSTLNLKFTNINSNSEFPSLYDFIVNNNLFGINQHNLEVVCGAGFRHKAYSSVLHCGNKNAIKYINNNIEKVVGVFPHTSIEEPREVILKLLNNANISDELKKSYLMIQNESLANLEGVETAFQHIIFDVDHVKPTWDNIIDCYMKEEEQLTDWLREYIERHYEVLRTEMVTNKDGSPVGSLFAALFANNTLPLEIYTSLVPQFHRHFVEHDLSGLEIGRMTALISNEKIKYTSYYISQIQDNFSTSIFGNFLIIKFQEYLDDEENAIEISNELGVYLLRSTLTLEQKIIFLNSLDSLIAEDVHVIDFANEICFYYAEAGVHDNSNIELLITALAKANNWQSKIRVINAVNSALGYDKERVTVMLNTLGEEYSKLNYYCPVNFLNEKKTGVVPDRNHPFRL